MSYSNDGKFIASGGSDKTVIVWSSRFEGIVKYKHRQSVQCLAFNPKTQQLASGCEMELGLWYPEQRSVEKHAMHSKILIMDWTSDGHHLALGHFDGRISIRDVRAREKVRSFEF